ncbi:MAG TPA: hypothetical protein DHV48_18890 [Prolixibacteraceae bacterium]|nr:MAG: hypothetical protein A2066_00300 [Bacteroidetes bacterium GWB2_41_8]HCY43373.1 hypothetical protein [Prolixibacteraceae bacterium]
MEEDNIYKRIQEAISSLPENFSVLEEQIDIELQMEYFNYGRDLKTSFSSEMILQHQADLFNPEVSIDEKKNLLVLLASQEKVEAFRTIEKYAKNPDVELRDWSILALQESRMVIQSSLMDEQQVYISTGLGGKGQKLRYFVVLIGREDNVPYSPIQQKLIKNELEFTITKNDGELEEISFCENLAIAVLLLPVKSDIQGVFVNVINECNQYGDFIRQDIIITNVKRMGEKEIKQFINRKH